MSGKKITTVIVVVALSILLIMGVYKYIFDLSGKVNQGKYRISDAVIVSNVKIDEKQEAIEELSNMVLDISQENKLSLLIPKNDIISRTTIDNINVKAPLKSGKISINQTDKEKIYDINNETEIEIYPEEKNDEYLIEIDVVNENCIKDINVPSQTNVVRFDGTILDLLNQKIEDFKFNVSFNLNLYDEVGKNHVCKIKLNLPDDELINDGIVVKREDLSNYIFKTK